jgi:hypothetical protein
MKSTFQALLVLFTVCLLAASPAVGADQPKPLKALLVIGGGFHDYAMQKEILKKGLEARANLTVDICYTPAPGGATKTRFDCYTNANWAKAYDVVIHDECSADVNDVPYIENIVNAHKTVPAVNLHCAMHCYRVGNPNEAVKELGTPHGLWFEYLGLQSSGHGPQEPITLDIMEAAHPVTAGLTNWTTTREELYNNIRIFETAKPLIKGKQVVKARDGSERTVEAVVAWSNDYHGSRIFSTTLGHNNATVADGRYLDLVTRGLLWATDKLDKDGKPKAGYGPKTP